MVTLTRISFFLLCPLLAEPFDGCWRGSSAAKTLAVRSLLVLLSDPEVSRCEVPYYTSGAYTCYCRVVKIFMGQRNVYLPHEVHFWP